MAGEMRGAVATPFPAAFFPQGPKISLKPPHGSGATKYFPGGSSPPKLPNTPAVWMGGNNMSAGEQPPARAQAALFPPLSVSIMLDSNGSNPTAVAAVVKIEQTLGDLKGKKVLILAGTGPVGQRAA